MTDEELLQKICQGDSRAFESLFKKYKAIVFGLSRRILGAHMLAEENSQEVWMKVISAAASFQNQGSVKSWILQIAKNNALNIIRKRGWEEELPLEKEEVLEDQSLAYSEILAGVERSENLKAAIDSLPDRQRVAIVLWMQEDLSYADIAIQLDMNVNAVKVLIFRAKENLKRSLGGKS